MWVAGKSFDTDEELLWCRQTPLSLWAAVQSLLGGNDCRWLGKVGSKEGSLDKVHTLLWLTHLGHLGEGLVWSGQVKSTVNTYIDSHALPWAIIKLRLKPTCSKWHGNGSSLPIFLGSYEFRMERELFFEGKEINSNVMTGAGILVLVLKQSGLKVKDCK